jgi:hypothetical protein
MEWEFHVMSGVVLLVDLIRVMTKIFVVSAVSNATSKISMR